MAISNPSFQLLIRRPFFEKGIRSVTHPDPARFAEKSGNFPRCFSGFRLRARALLRSCGARKHSVPGRVVSGNRITTERIECESFAFLFNGVSGCAFGSIQRNIWGKWTR